MTSAIGITAAQAMKATTVAKTAATISAGSRPGPTSSKPDDWPSRSEGDRVNQCEGDRVNQCEGDGRSDTEGVAVLVIGRLQSSWTTGHGAGR